MIAQMRASSFQSHRGRVRISGADFEVRRALVKAMHLPLLPTFLRDPVVPRRILVSKIFLLFFGEVDGQWKRCAVTGSW